MYGESSRPRRFVAREKQSEPCGASPSISVKHDGSSGIGLARSRRKRQAFLSRDAVPRRCGQGYTISRHVTAAGAKVDIVRGQVEVADLKTDQIAQVTPRPARCGFASGINHGTAGARPVLEPQDGRR
jgi:hypothetical protein